MPHGAFFALMAALALFGGCLAIILRKPLRNAA